jgi:phage-related minor tail protein
VRLDAMTDAVTGAATDAIKAKLKKSTLKKVAKLRTKVGAASSAECKKAKKTLTAAAKTLRAMQRAFAKGSGRKLNAALATTLGNLAGGGATAADTVRAGLGC